MEEQNHSVKERLEQLETFMGKYTAGGKDLCVAFSGGVDSSLILKAAVKAATKDGSKVFAVTFDSRLHPSCDLEIANRVAAELGGVHKEKASDNLATTNFADYEKDGKTAKYSQAWRYTQYNPDPYPCSSLFLSFFQYGVRSWIFCADFCWNRRIEYVFFCG